jgi:hypothetical protein
MILLPIIIPVLVLCLIGFRVSTLCPKGKHTYFENWKFTFKDFPTLPNPDLLRKQYKDKGLVLHMPSYHNGVEAYCEPKEQYNKILSKSLQHWLKRV